jgi:hypothetical protein
MSITLSPLHSLFKMPSIDLESSTGLGSFHYTLSTPTDANAEATLEGAPTLVLVHPLLLASEIFHRKSNALVKVMLSSNK